MLTNYKGPVNSDELLQHLVGEVVSGVIKLEVGVVLILASGAGVQFGGLSATGAAFEKITVEETAKIVAARRAQIEGLKRELEQITQISQLP